MRELTFEDMEQVDGGAPPLMAAGIAIAGGIGGGLVSAGWRRAVVAGTLAAPAAVFAGVAVAATGVTSLVFGAFSVGTSILGAHAVNGLGCSGFLAPGRLGLGSRQIFRIFQQENHPNLAGCGFIF